MLTKPRSLFASFGLAALAYLAASVFTAFFWDSVFGSVPSALFLAATSATAWFGGFWPGVLVASLGSITTGFLISTPNNIDIAAPVTLFSVATFITYLIEERNRAEKSAFNSGTLFSTIFRASPVSISIARLSDGQYIDVNKAFLDRYDLTRDDVLGSNSLELNLWADPEERPRMIEMLREQGSIRDFEAQFRTRSDKSGVVLMSAEVIEIDGIKYGLSIGHDITERKKAEEALRFQELLMRETGQIAKVGGWDFDPLTGDGCWTEEVARIHDLDPAQETNKDFGLSFYKGESRTRVEAAVNEALERGIPYDLELELTSAIGKQKWIRTIGHPIIEQGKVVRVRGSLQDITERKQAEEALRESQQHYQMLVESLPNMIWICDATGACDYLSRQWLEYTGRPLEEQLGYGWAEHIHPDDRNQVEAAWSEAVEGGIRFDSEFRIRRADGVYRWFKTRAVPLKDSARHIVKWFGSNTDIDDYKQSERRLQAQLERLNLLDQITRAIGERQDLRSIYQVVIRSLEDLLPIDFGCICSYDKLQDLLTVVCVGVKSQPLALELAMTEQAHIKIDQNGLSRCVRGQLVYEPDISQSEFPFPKRLSQSELHSLVIAPLLVESNVFGVLVAARRETEGFTSSDCEFLRQ
jgi:PAS domain S-box-containing protein